MQPTQLIVALFIAAMVKSTCAIGFEWQPEADVEIPGSVIHPPNALRRVQATTDVSSIEVASSTSSSGSSASASSSIAETEAPTTIMVLLPDNLAPSYSGSGSVMFFDGDASKSKSASAGSDSIADEATSAASGRTVGMMTALTTFTILTALVLA